MKKKTIKSAAIRGIAVVLSIIAWILIAFGVIGSIGLLTSESIDWGTVIFALIIVAVGILILLKASKTKKAAIKYRSQIDGLGSTQQETAAGQAPLRMKSVRCPGCGATNTVTVGKVSECEYCGTSIET